MHKSPKKWKMAVLVWMAIYPTITILFALFGHHFASISPLPLRTLVITLIVVPLMVFSILPALQKLLQNWMNS
jgi:antibiotic biosynthesis monooxygenase (ABM) superfamily enzyme